MPLTYAIRKGWDYEDGALAYAGPDGWAAWRAIPNDEHESYAWCEVTAWLDGVRVAALVLEAEWSWEGHASTVLMFKRK